MAGIAVQDAGVLEFLRERYAGATSATALLAWAGAKPTEPAEPPAAPAESPEAKPGSRNKRRVAAEAELETEVEKAWQGLDAAQRVALLTEVARDWPGQVPPLHWLAAATDARRAAEPPDPDATVKVARLADADATVRVVTRGRGLGPLHPDAVMVMRLLEPALQPDDIGVRLVSLMAAYLPRGPGAFGALAMALDRRIARDLREQWARELEPLSCDKAWAAAAQVWQEALFCSRPAEEPA